MQTLDLNKMGLVPMTEFEMQTVDGGGFFSFLGDILADILTVVGAVVGFAVGGPGGAAVGAVAGFSAAKVIKANV